MRVRVVESGQDHRALQVDDAGGAAGERAHRPIRADRDDAIAADGDGLGGREGVVDGPDGGVEKDEVRRELGGGRKGPATRREPENRNEKDLFHAALNATTCPGSLHA
jgi:hypothetical protein